MASGKYANILQEHSSDKLESRVKHEDGFFTAENMATAKAWIPMVADTIVGVQ